MVYVYYWSLLTPCYSVCWFFSSHFALFSGSRLKLKCMYFQKLNDSHLSKLAELVRQHNSYRYYAIFIQGLDSSQPYSGRKIHVLIKSWPKVWAKINWGTGLLYSNHVPSPDHSLENKEFGFFFSGRSDGGPLTSVRCIIKYSFSLLLADWHCSLVVNSHDRISVFPVFSSELLKSSV